jgi:hypothetical protein
MTEDRDPALQALFAGADQNLNGDAFAAQVLARVDAARRWRLGARATLIATLVLVVALLAPLLIGAAGAVVHSLAASLVELEGGVLAEIVSPVNNVATLVVLAFGGMFGVYRKMFR